MFNSAQYLLVNVHHVVNGGQYVNQMARSVDYSTYLVNTALEWSELTNPTGTPPQNLLMVNPIKVCYKQILI